MVMGMIITSRAVSLLKLPPWHLAGAAASRLQPAQVLDAALPQTMGLRVLLYCC